MERLNIPKVENETDEANWTYEHLEGLTVQFLRAAQEGRVHQGTPKRGARLEAVLQNALQTKELVIAPEDLNGRSLVAVLREKLAGR
jgi:hypothetical protein